MDYGNNKTLVYFIFSKNKAVGVDLWWLGTVRYQISYTEPAKGSGKRDIGPGYLLAGATERLNITFILFTTGAFSFVCSGCQND